MVGVADLVVHYRPLEEGEITMICAIHLIIAALVGGAGTLAAPPGISVVTGSRHDIGLTVVTSLGEGYLAGREFLIDIHFPNGDIGKGKLYIMFEPSTGCFLQYLDWAAKEEYPKDSWFRSIAESGRFVISDNRLVLIEIKTQIPPHISVLESSTEKADNIDGAESRSLGWYRDHLLALRERSYKAETFGYLAEIVPILMPNGFYGNWIMSQAPYVPLRLIDIVRVSGTRWNLTLENSVSPGINRRAQLPLSTRREIQSQGKPSRWISGMSLMLK